MKKQKRGKKKKAKGTLSEGFFFGGLPIGCCCMKYLFLKDMRQKAELLGTIWGNTLRTQGPY
jgi:hypothetical protein